MLFTKFIINNVLRQLENREYSALGVTLPLLLPFNSGIGSAELRCQRLVAPSTKWKDRHWSEIGFRWFQIRVLVLLADPMCTVYARLWWAIYPKGRVSPNFGI